MGISNVQNVLSNPTLEPHQFRVRNADRPISAWRSRGSTRSRAFLHSKYTIRITVASDDASEVAGANIGEVSKVREGQNNGKVGMSRLHSMRRRISGSNDLSKAVSRTGTFSELLRTPRVLHLLLSRPGTGDASPSSEPLPSVSP